MKFFNCGLGLVVLLNACSLGPETTPPVVEVEPEPPSSSGPVAYAIPSGAGPETLTHLAIRHHPRLKALQYRAERLAARVPQAEALPDPLAQLSLGNLPETAAGRVDAMAGISQKIPFPGKRKEAARAAQREALAIGAEASAFALKLAEQVRSAWWDYHLAGATLGISGESRTLLKTLAETVSTRVAANQDGQTAQLRVANEIARVDRDLAEARQVAQTAKARLNSLLNRPAGAPLPPVIEVTAKRPDDLASLLRHAETRHPEVISATHRIEAFQHRLARARLEKYPDFTVGVQGAAVASNGLAPSANGEDQLFGTLGVNLPLWQEPRRAMIRESQAGLAETRALLGATRSDLRFRIEDAYFRARTAFEVSDLFETRLIPDARQAYDLALSSYAAGQGTFASLIDQWQEWLAYRLQAARNRAQLGKALATLRAAAGLP